MNIWSKIITAVQLGVHDTGDMPIDSHAMRILAQEIRNTDTTLNQLQDSFEQFTRKKTHATQQIKQNQQDIKQYEGYAVQAMEQKNERLALDIAEKIAELEQQQAELKLNLADYQNQKDQLITAITLTEENLTRLKQQIDMVKATQSVHQAQETIVTRHSNDNPEQKGKIPTARGALVRLKQRHTNVMTGFSSQYRLLSTLSHSDAETKDSLQQKLAEAGIVEAKPKAAQILERIKNNNNMTKTQK